MRAYTRYIVTFVSLLFVCSLLLFPRLSSAQDATQVENYFNYTAAELQQLYANQVNMYTNCLEPYYVPEQGGGRLTGDADTDYPKSSWNGHSHVVMLRNKISSLFLQNSPIQVVREINNVFTCALDRDGKPACTSLYREQGGIGSTEDFKILDMARSQLVTSDGNLTLPHVKSYSPDTVTHSFTGIQYFTVQQGGQGGEDTEGQSLKLATFRPQEEVPVDQTDCLQIHWDPYGKVIDAQSLEPIQDATVTLFYRDALGRRTQVPVNAGILPKGMKSDVQTGANGVFNFPVIPGTYFLDAVKSGSTFPIETDLLERVRASLQQADPTREYLNSDKLYNNPNEEIVVKAQNPEERNIVMKSNILTDNKPEIIEYSIVRSGDVQIITGMVSHPSSIIQALIDNGQIGQATADKNGFFRIDVPSSSLPVQFDPNSVYLLATKQPLINVPLQANSYLFYTLWNILHKPVYAATNNISARYPLKLIPTYLGGFTYNDKLKVEPNAFVQITIPALGNAVYSQARADKNGFVYLGKNFTPSYQFDVRILDRAKNVVAIFEANEFISLNKTYTAEKKISYFAPPETVVSSPATFIPSVQLIKEVQAVEMQKSETAVTYARNSSSRRILHEQSKTPTPASIASNTSETTPGNNRNVGLFGALVVLVILIPVGIGFVIMKARNRGQNSF